MSLFDETLMVPLPLVKVLLLFVINVDVDIDFDVGHDVDSDHRNCSDKHDEAPPTSVETNSGRPVAFLLRLWPLDCE